MGKRVKVGVHQGSGFQSATVDRSAGGFVYREFRDCLHHGTVSCK